MKYKSGDKVRIKSLAWFNTNKCSGHVMCDGLAFVEFMTEWCGQELTIDFIYTDDSGKSGYVMKEPTTHWRFTDGMIEDLVDVEPQKKMVSLDDVCGVLYDMLHELDINDHTMVGTWEYDSVADFIKNFRKATEE